MRSYLPYLFFITSALLYGSPCIFPSLWPITLFFLIPFFYLLIVRVHEQQYALPLVLCFSWGAAASAIHLAGVSYSMVNNGPQSATDTLIRAIPLVFIFLYSALPATIILWLNGRIINRYARLHALMPALLTWIMGITLAIYTPINWYMFIFGRVEGYALLDPLLPLAIHPLLIYPLIVIPQFIGIMLLATLGAAIALFIVSCMHRQTRMLIGTLCCIGIICSGWMLLAHHINKQIKPTPDAYIKKLQSSIVHAPGFFTFYTRNITDSVDNMSAYYAKAVKAFPDARIITTHESVSRISVFPYSQTITRYFDAHHLGRPMHLILGAFRWDEDRNYNSAYWFYDGKLQDVHDKRHATPIEEHVPWFLNFKIFEKAYFGKLAQIAPAHGERKFFTIDADIKVVPYICSEFFFNRNPDEPMDLAQQHLPIIALCNDKWTRLEYLSTLMELYARYKAICWQRIIIYSACRRGSITTPHGTVYQLARYEPHGDTPGLIE